MLLVFPLLRHFAETIVLPTEQLNDECFSLILMCEVLDLVLACKFKQSSADAVLFKLQQHLQQHKKAHGTEHCKPKHHFSFHSAMQMATGVVLDCFVHERKHQMLKRAGTPVKNTLTYEASVLSRALLEQTRQLNNFTAGDGLLGDSTQSIRLARSLRGADARIAKSMQCRGATVGVGDVVFAGQLAGMVKCCAKVDDQLVCVMCLLQKSKSVTLFASEYAILDDLVAIDMRQEGWFVPYCWSQKDEQALLVLHRRLC